MDHIHAELSSSSLRLLRVHVSLSAVYAVWLVYKVTLISLIPQGSSAYHSHKR